MGLTGLLAILVTAFPAGATTTAQFSEAACGWSNTIPMPSQSDLAAVDPFEEHWWVPRGDYRYPAPDRDRIGVVGSPAGDHHGLRVAASHDGSVVAQAGLDIVRVFRWDTAAGDYRPLGAPIPDVLGADDENQLGNDPAGSIKLQLSIALSADGTVLAVGNPTWDRELEIHPATNTFSNRNNGRARLFQLASDGNESEWIELQQLGGAVGSRLGTSVAVVVTDIGVSLAVGAPDHGTTQALNRGAVHIAWWPWECRCVSVSDGSVSVLVNPNANSIGQSSCAALSRRHTCSHHRASPTNLTTLEGRGGGDRFGTSVSFAADIGTIAVGSPGSTNAGVAVSLCSQTPGLFSGQASVFTAQGDEWIQRGDSIDGLPMLFGAFGISVSLSHDGNVVAVGASSPHESTTGGYVQVFEWISNTTEPVGWHQLGNTILPGERSANDTRCCFDRNTVNGARGDEGFGRSVSVSADGLTVAVGASPGDFIRGFRLVANDPSMGRMWTVTTERGLIANFSFAGSVALSADGTVLIIGFDNTDETDEFGPSAYVLVNATTTTQAPTPSESPSSTPSVWPTAVPTTTPTQMPVTPAPTEAPSNTPSQQPTSAVPTMHPTLSPPTQSPVVPSATPSSPPSVYIEPSSAGESSDPESAIWAVVLVVVLFSIVTCMVVVCICRRSAKYTFTDRVTLQISGNEPVHPFGFLPNPAFNAVVSQSTDAAPPNDSAKDAFERLTHAGPLDGFDQLFMDGSNHSQREINTTDQEKSNSWPRSQHILDPVDSTTATDGRPLTSEQNFERTFLADSLEFSSFVNTASIANSIPMPPQLEAVPQSNSSSHNHATTMVLSQDGDPYLFSSFASSLNVDAITATEISDDVPQRQLWGSSPDAPRFPGSATGTFSMVV